MSKQTPVIYVAFGAAVAATGLAMLFKKKLKKSPTLKVTYFNIPATPGEKLRLALVLTVGKAGFEDDRVDFKDWPARKKVMKYGQMPVLTVDGADHFQSGACLRFIGSTLGNGSLYPKANAAAAMKIEEMLGLSEDLQRAWTPALYMGMNPKSMGYEFADDAAKNAKVKELRERFIAEELPKYMDFISNALQETGAFIAGPEPTIADCQIFPQLNYFTQGVADFVPADSLNKWPAVVAYLARFKALPAVKEWYGL